MEDASKEFTIFLSPKRDYQQPFRELPTASKHRVVPVVSKILNSAPTASSFTTMTQKKGNVYRAISGVSFQETDHHHHHRPTNNESTAHSQHSSCSKERRKSIAVVATGGADVGGASTAATSGANESTSTPGARRSRSMTSMESCYNNNNTQPETTLKKEIMVHPCTSVIMSSRNGGSSRRNRYARIREKRRSASQVRAKNSDKNKDDATADDTKMTDQHQQPVRPRRSRSASRSRKPSGESSFLHDNFINSASTTIASTVSTDDNGKTARKCDKNQSVSPSIDFIQDLKTKNDIDFNINESDWQKYEVVVSKQLNNILKGREEPEGGYFSLEREETEELEAEEEKLNSSSSGLGGGYFQRDNSNESIYVAQTFLTDEDTPISPYSANTSVIIEDTYREVLYDSPPQQVGFVDDEGLYEEIFFENKVSDSGEATFNKEENLLFENKNPSSSLAETFEREENSFFKNEVPASSSVSKFKKAEISGITSTINIVVAPLSCTDLPPSIPQRTKKYDKVQPPVSTIVYIGGEENVGYQEQLNGVFKEQLTGIFKEHLTEGIKEQQPNGGISIVDDKRTPTAIWCGCDSNISQGSFCQTTYPGSHHSSCMQSKSSAFSSKYSSSEPNRPDHRDDIQVENREITRDKKSKTADFELIDVDFDMFAPRRSRTTEFLPQKLSRSAKSLLATEHHDHQQLDLGKSTFYTDDNFFKDQFSRDRLMELADTRILRPVKTKSESNLLYNRKGIRTSFGRRNGRDRSKSTAISLDNVHFPPKIIPPREFEAVASHPLREFGEVTPIPHREFGAVASHSPKEFGAVALIPHTKLEAIASPPPREFGAVASPPTREFEAVASPPPRRFGAVASPPPREFETVASPPPSFQAFLQNSLFNPETEESHTNDNETLNIRNGQVITCITDSSSSDSDDSDTDIFSPDKRLSSHWLEAKNEFEFLDFNKKKKSKKFEPKIVRNIPIELISSSSSSPEHHPTRNLLTSPNDHNLSDFYEVPERPSRRRKRSNS